VDIKTLFTQNIQITKSPKIYNRFWYKSIFIAFIGPEGLYKNGLIGGWPVWILKQVRSRYRPIDYKFTIEIYGGIIKLAWFLGIRRVHVFV